MNRVKWKRPPKPKKQLPRISCTHCGKRVRFRWRWNKEYEEWTFHIPDKCSHCGVKGEVDKDGCQTSIQVHWED